MRASTAGARAGVAFAAGAAAVLTTHQTVLWALRRAGWAPWPAWDLSPTRPLGVPHLASAAFWGGAWWAALAALLPRNDARHPGPYYARAALLGATLPNAVGALLVALGHGTPVDGGPGDRARATAAAVLVNGAWGLTAAALVRAARRAR